MSENLSQLLKTDVRIDRVKVGLFDHITLKGVTMEDQKGEQMLRARHLSAKISITALLYGEISLRSVALLDSDIRLYKADADADPNFQFIIDTFSSDDKSPSALNLCINSIIIRRCTVAWDQRDAPLQRSILDTKHLKIKDIDANISLKQLTNDSLNLRIRSLKFKEESGLAIEQLTCRLKASKQGAEIKNLSLRLPDSFIKQNHLVLRYDIDNIDRTLTFAGNIRDARLNTSDLSAIVPRLRDLDLAVNISTDYKFSPSSISLTNLRIGESKDISIDMDAVMSRNYETGAISKLATKIKQIKVNVPAAVDIVKGLAEVNLPHWIEHLSYIEVTGDGEWMLKHGDQAHSGKARLNLKTDVGQIRIAADVKNNAIAGKLETEGLSLAKLLDRNDLPANITTNSTYKLNLSELTGYVRSHIDKLNWDNKTYANIDFRCDLADRHSAISIDARDNNAMLSAIAETSISIKHLIDGLKSERNIDIKAALDIKSLKLPNLYLPQHWKGAEVSGQMLTEISGLRTSGLQGQGVRPNGFAKLSDITIVTSPSEGSIMIPVGDILLTMQPNDDSEHLRLVSEFVTLDYDGNLSTEASIVQPFVNAVLRSEEDANTHSAEPSASQKKHAADTRLAIRFLPNQAFRDLTGIDLAADSPINLLGTLTENGERAILTVDAPHLAIGNTELKQIRFMAETLENGISCLGSVKKRVGQSMIQLEVHAESKASRLNTELVWDDGDKHRYFGNIKMQTDFNKPKSPAVGNQESHLTAKSLTPLRVTLLPTEIVISDTIWNIDKGEMLWDGKQIRIDGFRLSNEMKRSIAINGSLGSSIEDKLIVALQDIDVNYILNIVDFDDVTFGGLATGSATVRLIDGTPDVDGLLHIPQFRFNDGDMGDADIGIRWDGPEKTIRFDAKMSYPEDKGSQTKVDGWVSPAKGGMDLSIHGVRSKIQFLRPYTNDLFEGLDGNVTGDVRVFGSFKTLDFEGRVKAEASARIKQTGVVYHVSDADVEITPGKFRFAKANLTDNIGGAGHASGELRHTHLKNFNFDVALDGTRLLLYDKPRELDMPFFAHVVASGAVTLEGTPEAFTANIRITPEQGTSMTYIMDAPESYSAGSLLTLREHESEREESTQALNPNQDSTLNVETILASHTRPALTTVHQEESKTDIKLNFAVNATPAAVVNILMDDRTGDNISVRGSGMIQASWYNKGDMKMYGTYTVDSGIYNLSIQKLIHKKFDLLCGGTIVFTGNPLDSDLNFQASYMVNSASLADLNITSLSNKNIRVNCLLNITGKPSNVGVSFDIDMPTTSEEEKQMVRSLMASEEDMTTQVLYLLGFGRFYNYNYEATTSGGQSQTSTLMNSFLSNTLSSQFNNLLSNAIGNRNWTFGANVATGNIGWSDVAVEGLLSGRLLNNRLLLNGNFGYRDSKTSTQNGFVGDFDLQYLLTPQGSARLKAYSETNDRYFIKNASTTQGIGIVLQRDFNSILDLFGLSKKGQKQ